MRLKRCARRSSGQALVLVALMLVVLVGLVGLGIDGANAFAQRRNASIAVDAAAMAGARALLEANAHSSDNHNRHIYEAIDAYLTTHLSSLNGISDVSWQAHYIGNNGLPIGGAIPDNGNSVEPVDIYDTSATAIRGISVELHYSFNTFFIGLMGYDRLNTQGYGMAFVGPLGGVTGPDIVPVAINRTAANQWANSAAGTTREIELFVSTPVIPTPSGHIGALDLRQITLLPGGSSPTVGSASACNSYSVASPQDNLSYWWCMGTPHRVVTDKAQQTLAVPLSSSLRSAIDWRIAHSERSTVLFPVYESVYQGGSTVYNVRGFIAVKLVKDNGDTIKGKLVKYYSAPGPITGNTSGFFGSFAVNLVQ